jgi:CheY-like chemotaxis protein
VDDDAIVREVVAQQMEAAGYMVLSAESGEAALELLDAGEAIDLVVTDLSMPGMDGITVIREARRRRPGLPAILLTGFAAEAAEAAMGGAFGGDVRLLRKPIEGRRLADHAEVLLGVGSGYV